MKPKIIKDTREFVWTKHAIDKMRFYGLSENRVKKIFRAPDRVEEGIAAGTIAAMQKSPSISPLGKGGEIESPSISPLAKGGGKRQTEIWAMWQKTKSGQKKIITAWRYPGVSPARQVPIPEEILEELNSSLKN